MVEELKIDRFVTSIIGNGYLVRVDFESDGDEYKDDKFFFDTADEVLAFLETNLD